MWGRPSLSLVLIALLFGAGCLSAAPEAPITPAGDDDASPVLPNERGTLPLTAFVGGSGAANEPSIDITPDGRIFVTAIEGIILGDPGTPGRSPIWELVNGQWLQRGGNTGMIGFPSTRAGEIGQGDADLEIDSLGRFYHTDLWIGNDGMAVSKDGLSWIGSPVGHYVAPNDRQWFAHYKDQYLYLITNGVATGAVSFRYEIGTPLGEMAALVPAPLESPLTCICGPPGFPSVNQNNGYVYVPLNAGNGLTMYRSANSGVTWSAIKIPGAGQGGNLFPVSAVDETGTVYVVWSELKDGQYDIFLSRSRDNGLRWTDPVLVSTAPGTHLFPWIVAGEEGKIAIAWYGTPSTVDPNTASPATEWHVYYAQSLDARPTTFNGPDALTFTTWDLAGVVHTGEISLGGVDPTGAGPDRSLGDFLSMAVNPVDGVVHVAFVQNDAATPTNQRGVWVERMPASASLLS